MNENLKKIEESAVTCLNYKCAKKFEDCFLYLKHCTVCKPLFICQSCQHTYQTSSGFQRHICTVDEVDKVLTISLITFYYYLQTYYIQLWKTVTVFSTDCLEFLCEILFIYMLEILSHFQR